MSWLKKLLIKAKIIVPVKPVSVRYTRPEPVEVSYGGLNEAEAKNFVAAPIRRKRAKRAKKASRSPDNTSIKTIVPEASPSKPALRSEPVARPGSNSILLVKTPRIAARAPLIGGRPPRISTRPPRIGR